VVGNENVFPEPLQVKPDTVMVLFKKKRQAPSAFFNRYLIEILWQVEALAKLAVMFFYLIPESVSPVRTVVSCGSK
jgi:hypothetical protein